MDSQKMDNQKMDSQKVDSNESNLRNNLRVRSFLRGEIVHSAGASRTQCTIRDISETGARIQIPTSVTLPEYFDLIIPLKKLNEKAKMVWINKDEIGVIFIKKIENTPKDTKKEQNPQDSKIENLENEIYNLKNELIEIKNYMNQIINAKKSEE